MGSLDREQVILYLIQTHKDFNRVRANKVIDALIYAQAIKQSKETVYINEIKDNHESIKTAFWILLQLTDEPVAIDEGRYPAELIVKTQKNIIEIIIMNEDKAEEKLLYMSRRKQYERHIYCIVFPSGTIDVYDDEITSDLKALYATIQYDDSDLPRITFHEIEV